MAHAFGIQRAHMEEDTGKTTHVGGGGRIHDAEHSLVDYNRAGVPLVEIVSAPDLRSALQARAYVSELRAILVATGASDGKMEEGSLRVDANISVRRKGSTELGTRCEVKNMNSLRSLARAIDYEAQRQMALLDAGEEVLQETRHWNEDKGLTTSMRSKEEADDYRYFPEPDLVPLAPDDAWHAEVASNLPLLPAERRARLAGAVGDGARRETAAQVASLVELDLDGLVFGAIEAGADPKLAVNRASNEAAADLEAAVGLDPRSFASLLGMEAQGKLTATQAKAVLGVMLAEGGDPAEIASARGFESLGEGDLGLVVDQVIAQSPAEWAKYVAGDQRVAGTLIGKVMKATGKKADGKAVAALLAERRH